MSDPNTLGSLVRQRRLESGYSLGQLAAKVGKTAAEVRAWERDNELPEHGIIERLASTLEIDLGEIKRRLEAGKKALEAEREAAKAAAEEEAAAASTAEGEDQPEAEPEIVTVESEAPEEEEDIPAFVVSDPFTPPPAEDETRAPVTGRIGEEHDLDLLDAPTEAVPVPIITETATAARASRAALVLDEPPPAPSAYGSTSNDEAGLLRYLEPLRILFDPHNRYLYWIRAGLTVIVLVVLAAILMAQLGNLLDAIAELIDTIEPAARNPDQLEPIGMILLP